eukprot:3843094-Prymnesium_polylepis.2
MGFELRVTSVFMGTVSVTPRTHVDPVAVLLGLEGEVTQSVPQRDACGGFSALLQGLQLTGHVTATTRPGRALPITVPEDAKYGLFNY